VLFYDYEDTEDIAELGRISRFCLQVDYPLSLLTISSGFGFSNQGLFGLYAFLSLVYAYITFFRTFDSMKGDPKFLSPFQGAVTPSETKFLVLNLFESSSYTSVGSAIVYFLSSSQGPR